MMVKEQSKTLKYMLDLWLNVNKTLKITRV